jgi:excinuclease ABC subunit C
VIPNLIYTDTAPESCGILEEILTGMKGEKVSIRKSSRGKPGQWVLMAQENARAYGSSPGDPVLEELARAFRLPAVPYRMECYDISSFQGSHPAASRAVFIEGEPDKSLYRHYLIRGIEGQDDFAMMEQVLTRRLGNDESRPDLIIIDGGKGQLNIATRVLRGLGMEGIPVLSMAKARGTSKDRFFVPGRKDPVHLHARSPALFLLQRIRDEAHRFAVRYHKHLRGKTLVSLLEDIPGIGPKKARAVLMNVPDIRDLRDLRPEDLEGCPSLTAGDRASIIEYLGRLP